MQDRKVMDVATFGKAYCLNRNTVYRLVRQKSLPHVRIGKKIFFPVEAVEQFLMDQANRSMQG